MGLLERIFGGGGKAGASVSDEALARTLVERAAATVDKRLLHVGSCQARLREAALVALGHIRATVTAIPGPLDVDARAWHDDPVIRALFARAEDVGAAFGREPAVRAFFDASSATHCLALLGLAHSERRVLAPALEGGVLRQDVARTVVSFDNARVLVPGVAERPVRVEIGKAAVDYLALQALAQVTALDTEKRGLEEERALLRMKLQLAERAPGRLGQIEQPEGVVMSAELKRALEANRRALARHAPGELLDRLVEVLRDVLAHPDRYLKLEPRTVTLNAMNTCVAEGAPDAAATLRFQRLVLADGRAFAAYVARFPRDELRRPEDRMADAEKYL